MSPGVPVLDLHGQSHDVPAHELQWRPAAYGILIKGDAVLLCPQFGHKYDLPGGGIELGETVEQGLLREVKEETGLDATDPVLLDVHTSFFTFDASSGENLQCLMLYYSCGTFTGTLTNEGHDEWERVHVEMPEWVPIDSLDEVILGTSYDWRPLVRGLYANTRH